MSASKNEHTPGPWRVEDGTTLVWGDCNPDNTTSWGMGYPILDRYVSHAAWAKGRPSEAEQEANAHLIAAAPDLLESAIKGLAALRSGAGPEERMNAERALAAAIAKAEGRS